MKISTLHNLKSRSRVLLLMVSAVAVLLGSGFTEMRASEASRSSPSRDSLIQSRATNEWAQGFLLKPNQTANEGLEFRLAPLILFVGPDTAESSALTNNMPGAVNWVGNRTSIDSNVPAVYWSFDTTDLRGTESGRMTYLWFRKAETTNSTDSVLGQGIRLRLGKDGQPVLWEVLTDSTGATIHYWAKSYEAANTEGLSSGIRSTAPAPVVARVLEDGPLPMGPIVYVEPTTGDVLSVICRCMPAQVRTLVGAGNYELHPAETLPPEVRKQRK